MMSKTAYAMVGIGIGLVFLIVFVVSTKAGGIERQLPDIVEINEEFDVVLDVDVSGTDFFVIDETPPEGFKVIRHDGFTLDINGHLKHVTIQDARDISMRYTLQAPEEPGRYDFFGEYGMEDQSTQTIDGDLEVLAYRNEASVQPQASEPYSNGRYSITDMRDDMNYRFIRVDPRYVMEILDYNGTDIRVRLDVPSSMYNIDIPLTRVSSELAERENRFRFNTLLRERDFWLNIEDVNTIRFGAESTEVQILHEVGLINISTSEVTDSIGLSRRQVCRTNSSNVFVAYQDNTVEPNSNKYMNSSDNGTTWSGPYSAESDTYYEYQSNPPAVYCDSNNIWMAFRNITQTKAQIVVMNTTNVEGTWEYNTVQISNDAGENPLDYISIVARNSRVYLLWGNYSADKGLYFRKSTDGGKTFDARVRLSTDVIYTYSYDMVVDGIGDSDDRIYITYCNDTDNDQYFVKSTDGGSTFTEKLIMLSKSYFAEASITNDGQKIFIVAMNQTGADTYFINSSDEGDTWSVPFLVENVSYRPLLTIDRYKNIYYFDTNYNNKTAYYRIYNGTWSTTKGWYEKPIWTQNDRISVPHHVDNIIDVFMDQRYLTSPYNITYSYLKIQPTGEGGEPPEDSCTYGGTGEWLIDCSDYCHITDAVNMDGNKITATGTGKVTIDANITNAGNILTECSIVCGNGCFW